MSSPDPQTTVLTRFAARLLRATVCLGCALALPAGAEPDEDALGKALGYPLGTSATWYDMPYRVGSWSALNRVPGILSREVRRSATPTALPRAAQPAVSRPSTNVALSSASRTRVKSSAFNTSWITICIACRLVFHWSNENG